MVLVLHCCKCGKESTVEIKYQNDKAGIFMLPEKWIWWESIIICDNCLELYQEFLKEQEKERREFFQC